MAKIYFAGSIRGGRDDADIYKQIVDLLKADGHNVLSEHIAAPELTSAGNKAAPEDIFTQDTDWIRECDVMIAEVTQPSLGVGYELGFAHSIEKPIYCLWREEADKRLSAMVTGNEYNKIVTYTDWNDLEKKLSEISAQI